MYEELLLPLFICVVLPVSIVLIAMLARKHEVDRKTEVMLKAIESGTPVDANLFKSQSAPKSLKERLIGKLTGACITTFLGIAFLLGGTVFKSDFDWDFIFTMPVLGGILIAIGISLFIVYFVSKQMLAHELEAEEKNSGPTEK